MEYENFDLEKLKQESEEAKKEKAYMGVLGTVAQGFADVPSAYELIKGKSSGPKPNLKAGFDSLASNVEDPWEKQKKTYEMYKGARDAKKGREEDALLAGKKDPKISESVLYLRSSASAVIPYFSS